MLNWEVFGWVVVAYFLCMEASLLAKENAPMKRARIIFSCLLVAAGVGRYVHILERPSFKREMEDIREAGERKQLYKECIYAMERKGI